MYYGSDEFNNAIENTQGNALKTRLKFSDEEIIELISSMRYSGGSNDTDDLSIGNIAMAYVEVSAFTDKLLAGREFLLESGVKLSDGTYEYAPIGYFTIQTPSGDYDEVSFTAYDRMAKFEKVYSSSLTYPTDSAKVLNELCTTCGVELATPITNPITITENLKGYTCREVLSYIAGIHGFFACIDRFGKLNLRWYSDTPIVKSLKTVWAFEKSQEQYEVEKVEVAKDSETSFTSGNGIITLHHSNPYATQEITNSLYSKLGGYAYMPAEAEMLDDIRLDPWDVISVTYYDGIAYLIPCMSIIHDFGATSTTIRAVGKTSVENEYRFTGPTIQYLNRMATDLLVANRVIATKVDAEYVQAHAVTTENFEAKVAEIQQLVVKEIDGKYASIDLANIDVANIDKANIGLLFAEVGLITKATIVDGHVTGYLDSVEINADKITAGTLAVDRLVFRGTEKSIVYELNNITGALQAVQGETLNGEILTDRSITVDKIVAKSITANEIATETITANEILTGSITAEKLNVSSLSAITANLGTVTAGTIKSTNYVSGVSGMQLNLATGEWLGKYFGINSLGEMIATGGKIGNWDINTNMLSYEDGYISIEIKPPTSEDGNFIALYTYDEDLGAYATDSYWGVDGKGYGVLYTHEFQGTLADIQQIDATTVTTSFLDVKQDITVKGDNNILAQDYVCHTMNAGAGSEGYWKFATISPTSYIDYPNAPIVFEIISRSCHGHVTLLITGNATVSSYAISKLTVDGTSKNAYAVSVGNGVFDLYLQKEEAYGQASVTNVQFPKYMRDRVTITWKNEFVSSVPAGYITASRIFEQPLNLGNFGHGVFGGYDASGSGYHLSAQNFICNDWVRTGGATGWYSNAYGGGFYMQDYNYIRTYGSKHFFCDQVIQGNAVRTVAGADLDTLEAFRKYFEFDRARKKLSFLGYAYGNSSTNYGVTIRWGNSSLGGYVDDTYWLSMDYTGALRVGVQLNNASQPTWHTK